MIHDDDAGEFNGAASLGGSTSIILLGSPAFGNSGDGVTWQSFAGYTVDPVNDGIS